MGAGSRRGWFRGCEKAGRQAGRRKNLQQRVCVALPNSPTLQPPAPPLFRRNRLSLLTEIDRLLQRLGDLTKVVRKGA